MIKKLQGSILLKNTFIYMLLELINKSIPFFLLPVLTRFLSPADYGVIATYNSYLGVLLVFIGISLPGAVGVSFFHLNPNALKRYIGTVFYILMATTAFVFLAVIAMEPFLKEKLNLPSFWIYIGLITALMQIVTGINLVLWRSQQKAKQFAGYSVANTSVNMILSLFFIILWGYGWEGRIIGLTITACVFGSFSFWLLSRTKYATFNYSVTHMKDAIKFGIPLMPHQIALWARSGVDVLLITSIVGVSQTGLYNVGLQFGMVVGILAAAFNNAYSPYLYKKLKCITPSVQVNLVRFTYFYFVVILLASYTLSSFFIWLIPYFLGEGFREASKYIYWISLAYAFQGMYLMVVNYIFYVKKTHILSTVTVLTSAFHVVLSYSLIQKYGAIGAAYSSVVSFLLTFLVVWYLSNSVYSMPWFDRVTFLRKV